MKNAFVIGIVLTLLAPFGMLADWFYYRDRKPFIPPVHYVGNVPIRNDTYGEGCFGASRRGKRVHRGLDILAPLRSEVRASKGGIARVRLQRNGMGKYVVIEHTGNYTTLYGHLSDWCVKDIQRVRQGDLIGYVGKTGNARYKKIEPHIHFEVRKEGTYLDPMIFLHNGGQ